MNFFEKLKQLKNYDNVVAEKEKLLAELGDKINSVKSEVEELNKTKEAAISQKEEALQNRDAEIEKTRVSCEDVIKSFEERTNIAKEKYEQAINEQEAAEGELSNIIKERDLNQEKIKLFKTFLRKSKKDFEKDGLVDEAEIDALCPTVELHLNSFDVKDLKNLIKENQKITDVLLSKYESRYTTKSNKAIYQLMVLALRAELQNILVDLKYNNIDNCKANLIKIVSKFMNIASDGNQQIAPTIKNFIGEISVLFEQAIDIEYTYFVRKEKEREEQQALKEKKQIQVRN